MAVDITGSGEKSARPLRSPRRAQLWILLAASLMASACRSSSPPPSIVLAVMDTTRADAVSAYGAVSGTTPTFDALASSSVLYENAYANANWTVPSHATMFTGLLPHQHGLVSGNETMSSSPTLAERLQQAGYETVGMSENPWLAMKNGINRGFDTFLLSNGNLVGMVEKWARERKSDRPFLLFLNVMDAHEPYEVRDVNPFLPAGVDAATARAVKQTPAEYVCATAGRESDLAIVRGLYLGDVQAADAKLAGLLRAVQALPGADKRLIIVTSDHGEYLGEHWRVGHVIGVNEPVLHVPLLVHGLPGVAPARIRTHVQLADLLPSILAWVGLPPPTELPGQRLPTVEPAAERKDPIIAEYGDYFRLNKQMPDFLRLLKANMDQRCAPDQRMSGDMRSIILFPRKAIWYSDYSTQLFDIGTDPAEDHDLAGSMAAETAELRAALDRSVVDVKGARPEGPAVLSPDQMERMRALGYFDSREH